MLKTRAINWSKAWSLRQRRKRRTRDLALERIIEVLEEESRTSEKSFLETGGRLAGFLEVMQQTREATATLAGRIASEQADSIRNVLENALVRSGQMTARLDGHAQLLRTAAQAARELAVPVSGFAAAVRTFRVLSTMIRIETSRLGRTAEGLDALAGEVAVLTVEMEQRTQGMLAICEHLRERSERSLAEAERAGSEQKQQLPELVSAAMSGVTAVEQQRAQAATVSEQVMARYTRAGAALNGLVSGLQFHDIVRQQVEHVITALQQERALKETGRTAELAALQAAQLRMAADLFSRSVADLCTNLAELARDVKEMSDQTGALGRDAGSSRGNFFEDLERTFAAVREGLEECRRFDADLPDAGAEVGKTVTEIGALAREIEDVGFRMHLIALNTSVRAVHVGAEGEPLERLGAAIQGLCTSALEGAERIGTVLAALDHSRDGIAAAGEGERASDQDQELRTGAERLRASHESGLEKAGQAAQSAAQLAAAVEKLVCDLEQQRAFAARASECAGQLEQLAGEHAAASVAGGAQDRLEDLKRLYTMEAERVIHEGAHANRTEPATTGSEGANNDSEFGDNFELF